MKKLFYLIAGTMLPLLATAQLQNMDFENWEVPIPAEFGNKPDAWVWTNTTHTDPAYMFLFPPVEDAQSNDYALKLSVWYNYTKDGAVQTASIDYRPASLKGFYKYEQNFIYGDTDERLRDTAKVSVFLTKFNSATQNNDTIGIGILNIGDSTSAYTEFTVDIEYLQPGIPDNITVILDPSLVRRYPNRLYSILESGMTSYFTVDNLSLFGESVAGIEENAVNNLIIFPNPTQNLLHFKPISGELSIFDLTGKQVATMKSEGITSVDVSHLENGTYFIRMKDNEKIFQGKFEKF